jgi:hypothetical protein
LLSFAADFVGDDDETNNVVGPSMPAKKQIFHGQVIPICAGWFGDMCREFEDLIITNTQTFFSRG